MTAPETMTMNCPNEETLAAFVDDRLNGEARRRVVEHMANCAECRDIVVAASEYRPLPAGVVSIRSRSHVLKMAFAVAAVAAVISIVLGPMLWNRLFRSPMTDLVQASESLKVRDFPARLSADFPHRDYKGVKRGGGNPGDREPREEYWRIQGVAGEVQAQAGDHPSATQMHVMGVSFLLTGDYQEGVRFLEQALKKETGEAAILAAIRRSENAALLNDLAVGYHALIERNERFEFQAAAVEAVSRAWALQRTPAIAFTRASVLQTLSAKQDAIAAWRDYLALDKDPEWRAEAQHELDELQRPDDAQLWPAARARLWAMAEGPGELRSIVDRYRQSVRLWCEDELLPAWGQAHLTADPAADANLDRADALGKLLSEANGVHDVADAVRAIRNASSDDREQLARGHRAYGAGRVGIVTPAAGSALAQLNAAVEALTPERTPFAWRARVEHAGAVYHSNDYSKAGSELDDVLRLIPSAVVSVPLTARIEWMRGLMCHQRHAPECAVAHYRRAVALYEQLGERDFETAMRSQLAAALERAGRPDEALPERNRALRLLAQTGNPNRLHDVMFEVAYAAMRHDQPALAELFLDATVHHDRSAGQFVPASTSMMWRAADRFRRGNHEAAAADLQEAKSLTDRIADPSSRERALANLAVAETALRPAEATPAELAELDAAIDFYRRTNANVWLGAAYVTRARAHAAKGDVRSAEHDFIAALSEVRRARTAIQDRDARMWFTATADDVTDHYVEFLLDQRRPVDAFEVADSNRARELVDTPGAAWYGHDPAVLATAQKALPRDVAVIEYIVLPERIAAWVIARDVFEARILPASIGDVQRLLDGTSSRTSEPEFRSVMSALYTGLLAPLDDLLQETSSLVIVPDERLDRIPFAALYDPVTAQYVTQRRATTIAPSVAACLQSTQRYAERLTYGDRMLVIDATEADANRVALPDAAREARSVSALYRDTRVLHGTAPAALLSAAADSTLIHFAGHGVGDDAAARELNLGTEEGTLQGRDVVNAFLPRTRLVYLSACATDFGPVLKSEGSVTIARSFFAAGVPAVVATLWPVDDATARRIAHSFYERLREGSSPADALRIAQESLLMQRTGSRPDWAAFRVIGAGISFDKTPS